MSTDSASAALDAGNALFHGAYGASRDGVRHSCATLVVLPTELVLHCQGTRRPFPYRSASFGRAKSAAHIAVAAFALTTAESFDVERRTQLSRLAAHASAALERLELESDDLKPIDHEIRELLQRGVTFARAVAEAGPSQAAQLEFAREAGPLILKLTELATCEQIANLHAAVDAAFSALSNDEQRALQVVVVGDHQARTRSLGMQYFQRRFHEPPGADDRITYGENISNEEEAIALVGTRQLDKLIARAFFGDEKRLQRDVLGDAATSCLDRMQFG